MTGKIPNFLFHIPKCDGMLSYDELDQMVKQRRAPEIVKVIDNHSKMRLGSISPGLALLKFK